MENAVNHTVLICSQFSRESYKYGSNVEFKTINCPSDAAHCRHNKRFSFFNSGLGTFFAVLLLG